MPPPNGSELGAGGPASGAVVDAAKGSVGAPSGSVAPNGASGPVGMAPKGFDGADWRGTGCSGCACGAVGCGAGFGAVCLGFGLGWADVFGAFAGPPICKIVPHFGHLNFEGPVG